MENDIELDRLERMLDVCKRRKEHCTRLAADGKLKRKPRNQSDEHQASMGVWAMVAQPLGLGYRCRSPMELT